MKLSSTYLVVFRGIIELRNNVRGQTSLRFGFLGLQFHLKVAVQNGLGIAFHAFFNCIVELAPGVSDLHAALIADADGVIQLWRGVFVYFVVQSRE